MYKMRKWDNAKVYNMQRMKMWK